MSTCFCKRALSLGSWPCQLILYPNTVSCIWELTTKPFSPGSFVSPISSFLLFSCCVCHFPLKLVTTLPTDRVISFILCSVKNLTRRLMKTSLSALLLRGCKQGRGESTNSQEVSMDQDGKLSDLLGQLQRAVELNETARSKTTMGFHCGHNKVCFLWDGEKNISVKQTGEDGNMRWQCEFLFRADTGSDTDKWCTHGSLVTVILNNDSNEHEIHSYSSDTKWHHPLQISVQKQRCSLKFKLLKQFLLNSIQLN